MTVPLDIRTVFRSEYAYVRRTLERFGVPPRDLDDVCQEVFLRVHDRFDTYDPARPLRPWLVAFAHRVAANHRKRASNQREVLQEEPPTQAGASDPESSTERAQARRLLLRALDTLDPSRREVIVLHDLDELGAPQIAEVLEVPVNTVYSRLREGRKDLVAEVRRLERGTA